MADRTTSRRLHERSLWLNPALVVAAALAVFAIAFGTLTMRLASGHDPAIGLVSASGRSSVSTPGVTTRSSGAAARARTSSGSPAKVVTATSGARRGGSNVDA